MNENLKKQMEALLKANGMEEYKKPLDAVTDSVPQMKADVMDMLDREITAIAMTYAPDPRKDDTSSAMAFVVTMIVIGLAKKSIAEMEAMAIMGSKL